MPDFYLGMRGTGSWSDTTILDEDWRATIFQLEPNGDFPLTGITSMLKRETTMSKKVNWVTDTVIVPQAGITGVYLDSGMTNAYSTGESFVLGATGYIKVPEATADYFRAGMRAFLIKKDSYAVKTQIKITDVLKAGANSKLTVKVLKADTHGQTASISNADWIVGIGDINEEGADRPAALSYSPTPIDNVTGIIRTPLKITRSQYYLKNMRTNIQAYEYIKGKSALDHGRDLEMKLLWSEYDATTVGDDGYPEYSPMGIYQFIETYAPGNIFNYLTDTDFTGETWLTAGDSYLKKALETIMAYGSTDKLAIVGPTVIRAITDLAESNGQYVLDWQSKDYGLKIATFHSPYGSIELKVHPLLRFNKADRERMIILEPSNIITKTVPESDMVFYESERKDKKFADGADKVEEEWLSEITWEFHNALAWGEIRGVGSDNPLT
jgi:hypothetical protein